MKKVINSGVCKWGSLNLECLYILVRTAIMLDTPLLHFYYNYYVKSEYYITNNGIIYWDFGTMFV
jgi:hypothetical protein